MKTESLSYSFMTQRQSQWLSLSVSLLVLLSVLGLILLTLSLSVTVTVSLALDGLVDLSLDAQNSYIELKRCDPWNGASVLTGIKTGVFTVWWGNRISATRAFVVLHSAKTSNSRTSRAIFRRFIAELLRAMGAIWQKTLHDPTSFRPDLSTGPFTRFLLQS